MKTRHTKLLKQERDKVASMNNELTELVEEIKIQRNILTDKNNKLEELHREKNGLIGVVAHDLRCPLNSIKGITNLFPLTGELNNEQLDLLKKISNICHNGATLISDLLEINQHEFTTSITITEFEPDIFLKELIENYSEEFYRKSLKLIYQIDLHEKIIIATDRIYLTRIVDNIITNAIKFSPFGKSINLILKHDPLAEKVTIVVQDEGPGFSEEDIPHLYKKFKKLSAKPTGGENSTGLGLSIVKTLIGKIQGTIHINNNLRGGAEFVITIPQRAHQKGANKTIELGTLSVA